MDYKARIVRMWLALAILTALGLWNPSCWLAACPAMAMMIAAKSRCCCCTCQHCEDSVAACEYQIDVSGLVGEGGCVGLCPDYTVVVSRTSACLYSNSNPVLCAGFIISLRFQLLGTDYFARVDVDGNGASWRKNYGSTKPNCDALVGESIAPLGYAAGCNNQSSTCLVTAL